MDAILHPCAPDTGLPPIQLSGRRTSIGRDAGNDVVLAREGVSRRHAEVTWTGDAYQVTDLGSRNGTWVNDEPVTGARQLRDGDVVRFADVAFTLRTGGEMTRTLPRVPGATHQTVTVLFADLVGHTPLFERLGTDAAVAVVADCVAAMDGAVVRHGGRTVKTEGDGLLARFNSVHQAVQCAVAIQRWSASQAGRDGGPFPPVRIGMNSGEVIATGDDLLGLAVVKAARIAACAGAGEILLSDVTRTLLGPAAGLDVVSRGWHALKGISRKEHIYEVRW